MSDIIVDPRDAFEKVFPPPKNVIRCGKGYACTEYNAWGAHNFIRQWEGWSAAMLQGAELVTTAYKLNSPVIPDGWVACSERMPEESGRYWCYVEEQNDLGKSNYQWNCAWNGNRWWVEHEDGGRVTHWQPLPSPPAK